MVGVRAAGAVDAAKAARQSALTQHVRVSLYRLLQQPHKHFQHPLPVRRGLGFSAAALHMLQSHMSTAPIVPFCRVLKLGLLR